MVQCWDKNPNKRPTFKEIIELFKTDVFLNDKNIDRKLFGEYVDYIDNYKESITDSKFIRPFSHADKNKMKEKHSDKDDKILKSKNIPIINLKNIYIFILTIYIFLFLCHVDNLNFVKLN